MTNVRRLALCLAVLISSAPVLPGAALAQDAGGAAGRLEGRVVLSRELSQRRPRFRVYTERGAQPLPPAQASDTIEYGNVVVYLDSVAAPAPATGGPVLAIRQRNESFVPHVLPVLAGSSVQFPNDDPVFHNVFSLSRASRFDLGRFPRGATKSVVFDRPGIVQVFCHIHSDMSAIVVVRDNPYFVVPDAQGRFAIDGIPPGVYRAVAFHERVQPYTATVTIEPGRATAVEFTIPLSSGQQRR